MTQDIYVIDDDDTSIPIFKELFKEDREFKFIGIKTEQIDIALKDIPFLIIINEDSLDRNIIELCRQIRTDEDNQITPIIVVSSNTERKHKLEVLKESVEYYIKKPVDTEYLYYTIKNIDRLLKTNRRISPLTGLPGNVQIHAELKKRIAKKEEFSVLYIDLDNFKAYNDVYGFLKGDEIIEYTAQVILRWNLQRGVVVIPGSSDPNHIKENTELYDFELTDEEMKQFESLNRDEKHDWY